MSQLGATMTPRGDRKFFVWLMVGVAVVAALGVSLYIASNNHPSRPWKHQMLRDSGIVNGQEIPLVVVESFDDIEGVPQPSLVIERQDDILSETRVTFTYISPTGIDTALTVPAWLIKLDPPLPAGDPTARFRLSNWNPDWPLPFNVDVFLYSITVNLTPHRYEAYVAGRA